MASCIWHAAAGGGGLNSLLLVAGANNMHGREEHHMAMAWQENPGAKQGRNQDLIIGGPSSDWGPTILSQAAAGISSTFDNSTIMMLRDH